MRKFILGLVFAAVAFAQGPCTGVTGNIWGVPNSTVCPLDAAYLASLPTPVAQALSVNGNTFTAISLQAGQTLAGQGYFVDVPIMVWGWDPYFTMWQRILDGVQTYPDGTGTKTRVPSINVADYPPFVTPVPPGPSPVLAVVGGFNWVNGQGQSIYFAGPGDSLTKYPNGAHYTDARGTFTKTAVQNPFGWNTFWTLNTNNVKKPAVKAAVKRPLTK